MSFRRRMVLLAAGAVAVAVILASVVVYVVTRNELTGELDANLRAKLTPGLPQAVQIQSTVGAFRRKSSGRAGKTAQEGAGLIIQGGSSGGGAAARLDSRPSAAAPAAPGDPRQEEVSVERRVGGTEAATSVKQTVFGGPAGRVARLVLPSQALGGSTGYVQLIQSDGKIIQSGRAASLLPITAATRAVAAGRRGAFFSDATVSGIRVRILTERAQQGEGVWQAALPLTELDTTLSHLKLVLAIVTLGGIALAALLGLLVSRAALVPVRRLTGAAERVARTQDLGHRIPAGESDELGRLAVSFNTMLGALERSRLAQRQLISDASHELRTPLTSVKANLDALSLGEQLGPSERAHILSAARNQLGELTVLVGDLIDLSKTEVEDIEVEDVRLDLAVAGALDRARLHVPGCRFRLDAEPCLVRAAPARLDRAISNLLDNACKWNPDGEMAGPVQVRVRAGVVEVHDHGPGIDDADLPRVFDRFYRAPGARGLPGSGLGLAIVRQTAEVHGGAVHAANGPDGGATLTLELPVMPMLAADLQADRSHPPARPSRFIKLLCPVKQILSPGRDRGVHGAPADPPPPLLLLCSPRGDAAGGLRRVLFAERLGEELAGQCGRRGTRLLEVHARTRDRELPQPRNLGRRVSLKVKSGGPGGIDSTPHQMEAAQNACKHFQPKGAERELSPQERVEHEEAVQKFARCMREHGIKIEASAQGAGIQVKIQQGKAAGPNPESPAFQAAQTACQRLLPGRRGGPEGGLSTSTRHGEEHAGSESDSGGSLSSEG